MDSHYLIIILIILLVSIYFINNNHIDNFTEIDGNQFTNNKNINANKMRAMLYTFHSLCDEFKVYYIIGFGTLLGAVRHWGMIPWDDDVDIIVFNKDRKKIYQILNIMKKEYGYQIDNTFKLSRILFQDFKSNYFMDIFFVENINGKIIRTYTMDYDKILDKYNEQYLPKSDKNLWWWDGFDFDSTLLDKRKKILYDDLYLWGPENSLELLTIWYGKDFLTEYKTHYLKDHENYVPQENIKYNKIINPQL